MKLKATITADIKFLRNGGGGADEGGVGFVEYIHQGHEAFGLVAVIRCEARDVADEDGFEQSGDGHIIQCAERAGAEFLEGETGDVAAGGCHM